MKNMILITIFTLLFGVSIFANSDSTDITEVGTIDRSSHSLLNRNKGYLPDDIMEIRTILGSYWYTLVDVNKNVSVDLYIKKLPHSFRDSDDGKLISTNEIQYVTQIVMNNKSKGTKTVIWAQVGIPTPGGKYDLTYVPIYDIIVNKNLKRIRIIYQDSLSACVEDIDLNENIINRSAIPNRTCVYRTYLMPILPDNSRLKDVYFMSPDTIRVSDTAGGEYYVKIFNEVYENTEWLNLNLLWWNEIGANSPTIHIKKSSYYYEKSDKLIFEYVWDDWYQMNHIMLDSYEKSPYFNEESKGEFYDEYVWNNWVRMNKERFEEDKQE